MDNKNNSETDLDSNFVETINLLNENKISYWVCHGTLLGLIRDKQLIPWDHDIDFGILKWDLTKSSLIKLMENNGYKVKDHGNDYDFIIFTKKGGREVDFNFYQINPESNLAYSEWNIPRSKLTSVLDTISKGADYKGKWVYTVKLLYYFLSPIVNYVIKLLKKSGKFYKSAGYTTPAKLLEEFDFIEISGVNIRVPSNYESVLEYIYGSDWKIPKKEYDWVIESPSTIVSKSRY